MSLHATGQHPVIRAATEPGISTAASSAPVLSPEAIISETVARIFAAIDERRAAGTSAGGDSVAQPRPAPGARRMGVMVVLLALLVAVPVAYVGVSTYRSMSADQRDMAARIEAFEAEEERERQDAAERNHQELLDKLQQLTDKMGALTDDLDNLRQSLDAAWHVISPPDGVSSASKRAPSHPTR